MQFNNIRIPRKLKKKTKSFCGIFWHLLDNRQRVWYYMKPNHKQEIINKITGYCKKKN